MPPVRVISSPSCLGGLLLLDASQRATPGASAFRSSWCLLELCTVLEESAWRKDFFVDLAAHVPSGALKFGDPEDLQSYQDVAAGTVVQYYERGKSAWERSSDDRAALPSWLLREGLSLSWDAAVNSELENEQPSCSSVRPDIEALQRHLKLRWASASVYMLCGGAPVMSEHDFLLVKSLITAQAVNERMAFGETALFRASAWANEEAVKLLLASMAAVSVARNDGVTPVQAAVALKHHRVVGLLTKASGYVPTSMELRLARPKTRRLLALQEDILWSPAVDWHQSDELWACLERLRLGPHTAVDSPELNGITVDQLLELDGLIKTVLKDVLVHDPVDGRRVVWKPEDSEGITKSLNLHHLCDHIIKPLTKRFQCSWVRFIMNLLGEQMPKFLVSSWWGDSFQDLVEKLRHHQESRDMSGKAYWLSVCASNQHASQVGGRLSWTPLAKVLRSNTCHGIVVLVNKEATVFTRSWCLYELYLGEEEATKRTFYVDFCSSPQESGPGLPPKAVAAGARIDFEKATATLARDTAAIRREIAGDSKGAYENVNRKLRGRFVSGLIENLIQGPTMTAEQLSELRRLIREFPECLHTQGSNGECALFRAARYRCEDALKELLEVGASLILPNTLGELPDMAAVSSYLASLRKLLIKDDSGLSREAFKELASAISAMPNLEELEIRTTGKVGSSLLVMLQNKTKLKKLHLAVQLAQDVAISLGPVIAALEELEHLTLDGVEVRSDVQATRKVKELKVVDLAQCQMSVKVATVLGPLIWGMMKLEHLILPGVDLKGDGQAGFLGLRPTEPTKLNLAGHVVSALVLFPLILVMGDLELLDFSQQQEAGPCLALLLQNKSTLRSLNLANCCLSAEVAQQLRPLIAAMSNLEELNIAGNPQVGSSIVGILQNMMKLRKLNFASCKLSSEIAELLRPLIAAMPELEELLVDAHQVAIFETLVAAKCHVQVVQPITF